MVRPRLGVVAILEGALHAVYALLLYFVREVAIYKQSDERASYLYRSRKMVMIEFMRTDKRNDFVKIANML